MLSQPIVAESRVKSGFCTLCGYSEHRQTKRNYTTSMFDYVRVENGGLTAAEKSVASE